MRVKICGMMSAHDVELCVREGADALGFIFAPGARRLTIQAAVELTGLVPPFVTTVGVFANTPEEVVHEALTHCRLDVLQFAGSETPAAMGGFGKPTIVVVRDDTPAREDLREAHAVAVMADGAAPGVYGGTGRRVDAVRALALRRASALPFVLAGGLTPDNVAEAVALIRPDAVDVRSGVERGGRKDLALVRAFIRAAKGAAYAGT